MGDFYSSGKRKSKPRSASSSSESKSPLDKRSQETIDPETQDEQIEVLVEEPGGADEGSVALDMALVGQNISQAWQARCYRSHSE